MQIWRFFPLVHSVRIYQAIFNIKCSLSYTVVGGGWDVVIFQRLWLIWHDSSLIRAQTPACSAGMLLGEPFILPLDCFAEIWGLIFLFFTCLSKCICVYLCILFSYCSVLIFCKFCHKRNSKSLVNTFVTIIYTLCRFYYFYVYFSIMHARYQSSF